MRKNVFLILLLALLAGCGPTIFVKEYHRADDFGFQSLTNTKVGILVLEEGRVDGFKKAFDKVYSSKQTFSEELRKQALNTFSARLPDSKVVELEPGQETTLVEEFNPYKKKWDNVSGESLNILQSLERKYDIDMVLFVTRWNIAQDWIMHHRAPTMSPNGGFSSPGGTYQQKVCHVILEGGIVRTNGTPVYYGHSAGKHEVDFWAFKTALKKGVGDALEKYVAMVFDQTPAKNKSTF